MSEDCHWAYFQEGGKHVLFSSPLKGRLLRVRREDFFSGLSKRINAESPLEYHRRVIHPLLSPYHDIPEQVELSPCDLRKLRAWALESGKIPISRLPLWENVDTVPDSSIGSSFATIIENYKLLSGYEDRCWSVEIKPKAGYLAFSPLVHPKHRIKYEKSRFWLQQSLLARGVSSKGWASGLIQPSKYNPLDMFSCEEARINDAMSALLENPQNNLRIWDSHGHAFGHGVQTVSLEQATIVLSAISLILREESVLSKILSLQLLDVIDGDGAVMIYRHFLEISNGDCDQVHETLDKSPDRIVVSSLPSCLSTSPFSRPVSLALDKFLSIVEAFSPKSASEEAKDIVYSLSLQCLKEFSSADCTYLLHNWLLSLAMCDVSIFIALAPVDSNCDARLEPGQWKFKGHYHHKDHLGLLCLDTCDWVYTVKVVDCDKKPACKLEKRGQKERLIRKL